MTIDLEQFRKTYFDESLEGLDLAETGMLALLEDSETDPEAVNSIFRAIHSIKGGSGTFGLDDIASLAHEMETLLDEVRSGERGAGHDLVDALLEGVDCLRLLIAEARDGADADPVRIAEVCERLRRLKGDQAQPDAAAREQAAAGSVSGWRIAFRPNPDLMHSGNDPVRILQELSELGELQVEAHLDALPALEDLSPEDLYLHWGLELRGEIPREAVAEVFAWVEDECDLDLQPLVEVPAGTRVPGGQSAGGNTAVSGELILERRKGDRRKGDRRVPGQAADGGSIRVSIDKVDSVINTVGELVTVQSMLSALGEDFDISRLEQLRDALDQLENHTRDLQESVMRIRMMPISFVFNRFPRMVHDLCQKLDKAAELEIHGEQTELDKTVIEKIGDPLVHLVRNALDHGIEGPEEREAAGKSLAGKVTLNAYHKGGNVYIEIADDGRGLDLERLRAKALDMGLLRPEETLGDEQIQALVFQPGVSTAAEVSDVSGRGVGMDVVRRNVESLGGSISLTTQPGAGSRVTIRLPLTLAIMDGQLVRVGDECYVLPLVSVIESIQVSEDTVSHVAGRGEVFRFRGDYLPLVRLHRLFETRDARSAVAEGLLVVAEADGRRVGLFVDDLLGQQQVAIKSLEANYERVVGVAGATILGDGQVALILDVSGLTRLHAQHWRGRDSSGEGLAESGAQAPREDQQREVETDATA